MKNNSHIILIVEDDEISCELFKELLEKDNIKSFLIAKSGEEAIEICKDNHAIGVVLMDIKLPGINGHQALKEIKKVRSDIPVIAQTACIMNGAKDIYLNSGFDDFISKPINSNELKRLIEKYREPAFTQVSDIKLHVR